MTSGIPQGIKVKRAFSQFDIKSVDKKRRTISGVATTPSIDRAGDTIDPLGCKFVNPVALLWQHQHDAPIGVCEFAQPTKAGINFTASIPEITNPGVLKDRTDEAWDSIESGLVRAVSIGFRPLEYDYLSAGGVHFKQIEIYELSCVTVPANADCSITAIKHYDAAQRYAGTRVIKLTPAEMAATRRRLYGPYAAEMQ